MSTRNSSRLSRRHFLKMTTGVAGGLALSACGSEATSTPVPAAPATAVPEPTATPEAKEPVTIRMITHWTGEDAHAETMKLLYSRFQDANPDIKLDIVEIPDWEQADAKVAAECGAGNCPDVAFDGFNNTAVVDAGLVLPADDFLDVHEDIIDFAYMGAKYNGKYWKAFPEEISGFGAVYSKDLLAEIGMDEFPKTWAELIEAGEAVKVLGKSLMTFHAYWPPLFGFIQQSTPEGNQASIDGDWNSDTWVQTMEAFEQLVPYLPPDELELTDAEAPLRVRDGEMLFYTDGQWMIGNTGLEPGPASEKFGVAPFPTPAGKTAAGWNGLAIGNTAYANSDNPDRVGAAWTFLDFWATDQPVIESFIRDAQSPMGVRTDLITADLGGPFLPMFIEATSTADFVYTEEGAWANADIWGGVLPGFEALALGRSPEEATNVMLDIFKAAE
jgi:ABC-type glycerol-3-phosphate transport system substrate-binding protein